RLDDTPPRTTPHLHRLAAVGIHQLAVDPFLGREMHPRLLRTLAPERCRDVADPHDLVDLGAPRALELATKAFLAAARLTADDDALYCAERDTLGRRDFGNMQRIRGRAGERLGRELL